MSSPGTLDPAGPLQSRLPDNHAHGIPASTRSLEDGDDTRSEGHFDRDGDPSLRPPKKRQKRNKPTLSCAECVERKTKCDRGRPRCISCLKRQTECTYSARAELIYSVRFVDPSSPSPSLTIRPSSVPSTKIKSRRESDDAGNGLSNVTSSAFLLSHIPYSKPSPSDVFGVGKEHPFANYWTCQGGLPEVIGILPKKDQADILVAKYFECVDPVYPMLNQQSFLQDYENFWQLQIQDKYKADPGLVALQLIIYAMGTQFFPKTCATADGTQQAQMAEFYVSAAHQALRIFAYLSRVNLSSIQAMILICYFLMNDNKASDAWAFGGVLIRQAYALGLNRCPDIIVPDATPEEKQQRRKVWQAVFVQDTFLTILLSLPPTSTFSDCTVDSLTEDPEPATLQTPLNLISTRGDVRYTRTMWHLANLVQRTICYPRALSQPATTTPASKRGLVANYQSLYREFPHMLTETQRGWTAQLVQNGEYRTARQSLFLRSNYWHSLMLIHADEGTPPNSRHDSAISHIPTIDARAAVDAARTAIATFFDLWQWFETEAGVWWVFQHRAYEEALMICRLLAAYGSQFPPISSPRLEPDPLFIAAKADVARMLEILEQVGTSAPELQKTRREILCQACEAVGDGL
ncbi:hypothetical protein P152DRAFT_398942 [Eremomyces bilateralis CBS 781.70]|uniref:Zn(2)-C6 fungal-type domain-containing protein n=1 Tax=Eremomyces bilateralis CBS 781.70 TaxID=1392243 RepID=A0A6G1G0J8_9PEZI|nr:uncharacterized protein P152DRAFT_398942 [Eremomyces bilateralis CBS 781.70]KAF1811563.1 hypothetical protein P152DRAFT_398942 [Eremomyces bilateralis CBS 781.70]